MNAQALEIAVPTERGNPILACRKCLELVSGVPGGRGCKSCNWYLDWDASWDDVRQYPMTDKESERDARLVEFTRLVAGYTLEFDDMEVIPPTAASKGLIRIAGHSAPADFLYRMIEVKASRFSMTAEEFLELGIGAIRLLSEFHDPPEEPGDTT